MMRKLAIILCVVVALPSVLFAGANVVALERMVGYLSQSLSELKVLAAYARAARGAAKEEAFVKGRAELAKLKPVFQNARQEAQRLQQQESIERWRERIDRLSDLFEAYKKVEELNQLEVERDRLKDEFCDPRDLYRFSEPGNCPEGDLRQFGVPEISKP